MRSLVVLARCLFAAVTIALMFQDQWLWAFLAFVPTVFFFGVLNVGETKRPEYRKGLRK